MADDQNQSTGIAEKPTGVTDSFDNEKVNNEKSPSAAQVRKWRTLRVGQGNDFGIIVNNQKIEAFSVEPVNVSKSKPEVVIPGYNLGIYDQVFLTPASSPSTELEPDFFHKADPSTPKITFSLPQKALGVFANGESIWIKLKSSSNPNANAIVSKYLLFGPDDQEEKDKEAKAKAEKSQKTAEEFQKGGTKTVADILADATLKAGQDAISIATGGILDPALATQMHDAISGRDAGKLKKLVDEAVEKGDLEGLKSALKKAADQKGSDPAYKTLLNDSIKKVESSKKSAAEKKQQTSYSSVEGKSSKAGGVGRVEFEAREYEAENLSYDDIQAQTPALEETEVSSNSALASGVQTVSQIRTVEAGGGKTTLSGSVNVQTGAGAATGGAVASTSVQGRAEAGGTVTQTGSVSGKVSIGAQGNAASSLAQKTQVQGTAESKGQVEGKVGLKTEGKAEGQISSKTKGQAQGTEAGAHTFEKQAVIDSNIQTGGEIKARGQTSASVNTQGQAEGTQEKTISVGSALEGNFSEKPLQPSGKSVSVQNTSDQAPTVGKQAAEIKKENAFELQEQQEKPESPKQAFEQKKQPELTETKRPSEVKEELEAKDKLQGQPQLQPNQAGKEVLAKLRMNEKPLGLNLALERVNLQAQKEPEAGKKSRLPRKEKKALKKQQEAQGQGATEPLASTPVTQRPEQAGPLGTNGLPGSVKSSDDSSAVSPLAQAPESEESSAPTPQAEPPAEADQPAKATDQEAELEEEQGPVLPAPQPQGQPAAVAESAALDAELAGSVQMVNAAIDAELMAGFYWILGFAIPTAGLSLLLGAIVGDLLLIAKPVFGWIAGWAIKRMPVLPTVIKNNVDAVVARIKISLKVKTIIFLLNFVVVVMVLGFLMFVTYVGCNTPFRFPGSGYRLTYIGSTHPEVCEMVESFTNGYFSGESAPTPTPNNNPTPPGGVNAR